jgi:hypothetical protein
MTSHGYTAHIGPGKDITALRRSRDATKNLVRKMIYQFGFSRVMKRIEGLKRKVRPLHRPGEIQRCFWVDEVNKSWSDSMEIFKLVDQDKLSKALRRDPYPSKLKAKIVYLGRLIRECQPSL